MYKFKPHFSGMRDFAILWSTQTFSALGSAMTSFALVLWAYRQSGSAVTTALLSVCSYAPYVAMSIFAGALCDRWDKKRTMLLCDLFAALTTFCVLLLARAGRLHIAHLYILNALNGLMNTLQKPAADVTVSLLVPRERYQRAAGMQALGNALTTVLAPVLASMLYAFAGLEMVIFFDLGTCFVAVVALACFVRIPARRAQGSAETPLQAARAGLRFLRREKGVLHLILFLSAINLIASMYNAALPAMAISRPGGGEAALGWVNACTGVAGAHAVHLVSGRAAGLGVHTGDERQHGRAFAAEDTAAHAGARLRGAQHAAILHHPRGLSAGRLAGGRRLHAADGRAGPREPPRPPAGHGRRRGRGAAVFDPRLRGRGRLPAFPPRPPHTRAGEVNDKPRPIALGRGTCAHGRLYFFISSAPAFHALPACSPVT